MQSHQTNLTSLKENGTPMKFHEVLEFPSFPRGHCPIGPKREWRKEAKHPKAWEASYYVSHMCHTDSYPQYWSNKGDNKTETDYWGNCKDFCGTMILDCYLIWSTFAYSSWIRDNGLVLDATFYTPIWNRDLQVKCSARRSLETLSLKKQWRRCCRGWALGHKTTIKEQVLVVRNCVGLRGFGQRSKHRVKIHDGELMHLPFQDICVMLSC